MDPHERNQLVIPLQEGLRREVVVLQEEVALQSRVQKILLLFVEGNLSEQHSLRLVRTEGTDLALFVSEIPIQIDLLICLNFQRQHLVRALFSL